MTSTTRRRWAGVVPQQPPTIATPCSSTKVRRWLASSSGVRRYLALPPTMVGRPAFGRQEIVFRL